MNKDNFVTCLYCEHLKYDKSGIKRDYMWFDSIPCQVKGKKRRLCDTICESFVLKSGMHTKKDYPGKVENNTY